MKNLELTQMELIKGSEDCLDATIGGGIAAGVTGAVSGSIVPGAGTLLGAAVGWFSGSIGGFVACAAGY